MAASSNSALLWLHYDGSTQSNTHGVNSTVRQHVMLNHSTNKAKRRQKPQIVSKSTPANNTQNDDTRAEEPALNPLSATSSNLERALLSLDYHTAPTPGLTNDEHRSIYKAIWWHRFSPLELPKQDEMDWTQKYRVHASELLWELARSDKTFLEIFMCYGAAKEIALTGSGDLRLYFRHQGRAISMVSRDVDRESCEPGENLRTSEKLKLA
jgi:hypothetical protein